VLDESRRHFVGGKIGWHKGVRRGAPPVEGEFNEQLERRGQDECTA